MASIKNIERSPKVTTFMRNVGKSFKIIASDVLEKENLIPQTRKQFKVYNDYFNDIKIRRNEKRDLIMSSRQLNRTRIYDSSNKFMERAWDELKSNPIYEKEREEYFEDEEEKEISSSDLNQSIQNSGRATSTMIGRVGEYIIDNMRISNNLQKNSNLKILNAVTSGFKITNNYLDKIASNTSQLNSHMSNSVTFYQNMLSLQKQSVEIQMAMYENQNAINNKNSYKPNTPFDKIYGKGYFDFGEYFKEVGANMATMLSSNNVSGGLMYKIINPILSTDLAKLKTNPIETIFSLSTRLAIRNISAVEGLVTKVSEGLDNFFPNLLNKIANLSSSDNPIIKKIMSNPMASKILSILGLKVEENTTIDPSKFDKGPVPFDGVTRRTIVKTIPEYLARIESALTGKEERYMDNISGKWIKKSQVKERNQEIRDRGYKAGTKAIRDQIQGYLSSNGMTDQVYNDIIDTFLRQIYNKGGMSVKDISVGGIDRNTLFKIARQKGLTASEAQKILKALDSEAVRSKARSSVFEINKARNENNKFIASEEAKGYDLLSQEVDTMARGGRVRGHRGEPTLAIMTAGEKVVNTFGPRQTAINAANESAYARSLGLNVPMYATGTNPLRTARDFAVNAYGKVKEKGSELLETLKSDDMASLVMEFAPNADKNKVQTVLNKTATAIPRGLKGAGIGGIIGFLTGMPLIGMAVGSGIGIASVSDTVKNLLFGKDEEINPETGEVISPAKKGVIPKSWTDFAKKALPAAKIGGIIGGAAGLLTGGIGILPAAVIGAGAGVALSSNKVREFLFGKTNEKGEFEDTGLIKKKVQDFVKAKAPGMALGAVGGVVSTLLGAGPFGLLGNAVLGAGTSLLVTSDKFKDFMLGKEDENGKRSGGLLGDLKLRVLDPLINAGQELLEEGKKFFKVNVFDNVKKFLNTAGGFIMNTIADTRYMLANMFSNGSVPIDETLGSYTRGAINFGKKVLTAPVRLVAGAATLPFRALGGISNRITDRMISRGNASNMTAQERLNYRRTRRRLSGYNDRYTEADRTLANASIEDLRRLYVVSNLGGPNIEGFTDKAADAVHKFTDYLLKNKIPIKESNVRKLQKDIARGDAMGFSRDLNSVRELNANQMAEIYDVIGDDLAALQELRDKQGGLRASQSRSMNYIKQTFGIKGKFGRLQLGRFNRNLSREISSREAADRAEADRTNIIDPNGNQYENAFRNVVSTKLDRLITLLGYEVENTEQLKNETTGTSGTADSARSRFDQSNSRRSLRESISNTRRTMKNHIKLGFSYGWGASRYLMRNGINLGNLDPALIRTLKKLNLKISSKDTATLEYIIKSENRDKLLELIDIIKTKGLFDLKSNDIVALDEYIEKNRGNYGNVLDFFTLVFKKGGYRLGSSEDLTAILDKCQIDNTGLSNLTQNLKYVKFTGQNADPEFIARTTHEIIEFNDKKQASGDYDRVNRFSGKLLRTGNKLTKAGQTILKFGRNVMFGKDEKSDNVSSLFDFVKNYGVMGGLRALMLGDETQTKSKFLKNGGLFGAIKGGAKNVVGFFFGKDKDGETIFQRHGLLGYIPAAIFGDDKSPGLLGNTLLGKGVKIFGKILKGLLIAAVAAPIVGQAVHFFKTTLKPVWATVIQPWWNEHITQPLTERWNKAKITLFGEKKVRSEDGEEYYEGGLLSGPLNALRKPIGKIRDFFNGLKAKWQEAEEKSGSKTFGGVLKYLFIGNDKLLTGNIGDGTIKSNGSIIGSALEWILKGYSYLKTDVIDPAFNWIKNTGGPWLVGVIKTAVHNVLHPNNQYTDMSFETLVSRGNGTTGSSGGGSQSYTYNSDTDTITDSSGNIVSRDENPDVYNNLSVGSNGYSGKRELTNVQYPNGGGFIAKEGSHLNISIMNNYVDMYCRQVYHITGSYIDHVSIGLLKRINGNHPKRKLDNYYVKQKGNYISGGVTLSKVNMSVNLNYFNNIGDYAKSTGKKYNGEDVYYCTNNETYYVPRKQDSGVWQLEPIYITAEMLQGNENGNREGSGSGFSRNHIYQNDPRIRNTRFGKSTIGDAGCGPVAAANLMGGALGYATDYAQKGGFVNNDGSTSINYFTSMFNGRNTTSREEVRDRLKSNRPVVLLGRDESNGVYGSNNHFVTAKGYDRSGNIIVEDPDLPQSSMRYPASKVFSGMKAASLIGGRRRMDDRLVNYADDTASTANSSIGYSSVSSTTTESTGNTVSSILSKLGNLASLIFKKTFGITWDDISGSTTSSATTTGNSGVFSYGSSLSDGGTESKTFTIKGGQRTRFVEVAKTQVGYQEGSNNNTKYGAWYGANNNAWCVMFISWCAEKAGIPTSVIPKMASTTAMCNWFGENNRLHLRTSMYIPLPGDIVFFTGDGSKSGLKHTGMVESVNGTTLITIEGNYSDKVTRREYTNFFNNSSIYAFGSPNFADDNRTITVEGYGSGSVYSVEDQNGNVVYDANDEKQKIWKFLRNKAGLSPVGASGLFGAWEAESGLKPKRVEYDYSKNFPGYDAMNNKSVMDNFTKNVLFKQYESQGLSINKDAYLGNDGYLYPGLGLAQWTGPRGKSLFDYVKNNGYRSIFDTDAQLNYAKSEFDKSYPSLIGNLNNAATPEEAAKIALDGYEMYNGFAATHPDTLAPRAKNARAYYDKYKGLGRNYRESRNPIAYGPSSGYSGYARGSYISYEAFLETIIQILINISNNTNAVNKILDVLSSEGANLSAKARAEISSAVSSTNSIENLKTALRNNMAGQSTGISSMITNSRTDLIIKTMKEIAAQ